MIDAIDIMRFSKDIAENAELCKSLLQNVPEKDYPDVVVVSEYLGQIILFARTIQAELAGQM